MKLLFFSVNRSPFMVELVDNMYNYLPSGSEVKMILQYPMEAERSHCGEKNCNNPIDIFFNSAPIELFLSKEKPDTIIYSSFRTPNFMRAKKWAKKNGVKFFVYSGEKLLEYGHGSLYMWLKYKFFQYRMRGIDGQIAISNRAMGLYQKYCTAPTIVVPYTFDMTRLLSFTPLEYDGKSLTFLISGRLEPFRDPIYSIRLFADLKKLRPNIDMKLIISGKGSLYDDILKLLDELNIADCTTWMNDFKEWSEIHEIYKKAHVLLCLQAYGGWGLVIPEAMAAGMLVAGSSGVDSADNLIIDGYNGLYCNTMARDVIIKSMLDVFDNPSEFNSIRRRAKECAKYGDVFHYAKQLVSFIQNNKQ